LIPTFRAEFGASEAFCAKVVDVVSWIGQPAYGESLARQGHGKHYTFACHPGRRRGAFCCNGKIVALAIFGGSVRISIFPFFDNASIPSSLVCLLSMLAQ
jgi:hypothetical protein